MSGRAADFSPGVIKVLRDRVNGLCSNPKCRRPTVGPDKDTPNERVVIGKASHIKAASPGGPRYDDMQSEEDRRSIENGIWLCALCADLIDKNAGADYSVETITAWKVQAETNARNALENTSRLELHWGHDISQLRYVNLPALMQWTARYDQQILFEGLPSDGWLHSYQIQLVHILVQAERALAAIELDAVPVKKLEDVDDDWSGLTISFSQRFYTKNGPDCPSRGALPEAVPSDWQKATHIHTKIGKKKLVMVLDPRWITTTTAFVDFRRGQGTFAGIAILKECHPSNPVILASPLVIGHPKPLFDW